MSSKKLADFNKDEVEREELRATLRRTQTALTKAKAKTEDLVAAVYQASRDAAIVLGPVPPVPTPRYKASGKPEMALAHLTDLQYGKKTETYSMDKCAERVELYADKIAVLTQIQRADHPVSEGHVLLGGDFVEGLNIFPGQAYEVEAGLFEQLFGVARVTENFIRRLLALYNVVHVWQEEGNHGRLGRRGEWPRTDNTDLMAYKIVEDRFAGEKRVVWHPRHSFYQIVTIGAYRAMLIHGDEIKSFGGNTPSYGLLKKGTAWSSGVTEPFRDIYFGHFHTHLELTLPNSGAMFGTGSTESDNIYAQEFVAAKGMPSQRLHFIDPRKGRVAAQYKVYLSDNPGETFTKIAR